MYSDVRVKIPVAKGLIIRKKIKNATYIYYKLNRVYDSEKRYSIPTSTTIGRMCEDDPTMMFPNDKFLLYFPDAELPEVKPDDSRSCCLRMGTYAVLQKLIKDMHLDTMIDAIIGKEAGLFLDLAAYSIITEDNAAQYYPDYAYNHPLFTDEMRIYSDSKVSSFINGLEKEQSLEFLKRWNAERDHRERIYISYDSTNKNCQAGEIELAEFGHAKDDKDKPVVNYSVGYDMNNRVPLFYEAYPGSIVDVSQLQFMLEKAKAYGYKRVGFILDRGYFSQGNIRYLDKCGYEFILFVKGMKELVKDLVLRVKGTFEESRAYSIRKFGVSGITIKDQLFPSDTKERYFHIYYNEGRRARERGKLEEKIDRLGAVLKEQEGTIYEMPGALKKYFEPFYYTEGEKKYFECAREKYDVIDKEISLCGYFVLVTSEKMTAKEALILYKSRDGSEKLFSGDKTYLGNRSFRTYSRESTENKIFIEFIALIIRNSFFTCLKDRMMQMEKKENFMTVPAAIKELEKIEMIRLADGNYRLAHAVTKTQKEILEAFGMTERTIKEQAIDINKKIKSAEDKKDGSTSDNTGRKDRKTETGGNGGKR